VWFDYAFNVIQEVKKSDFKHKSYQLCQYFILSSCIHKWDSIYDNSENKIQNNLEFLKKYEINYSNF